MWMGLGLALLVGRADAREAEVAVVGAHIPGQGDAAAQELAAALEAALADLRNVEPVEAGLVRSRMSGREGLVVEGVFLTPGRRALEEGRVLYERADFESAITVLEEASAALRDGLAGAGESRDLIEALLLLGLANAAFAEEDAAREAFAQVVVLEPQRQLDRFNYPPKFVNLFNEVREEVLAGPRAELALKTPDDTTRIMLDGRLVERSGGVTRIGELVPGDHYLLVESAGGRRSFEVVSVGDADRRTEKAVSPSQRIIAPAVETDAARMEQTALLYRSLGEHAETELLLLAGSVGPDQVGVQLYEPRTGNFSRVSAETVKRGNVAAALKVATLALDTYVEDGILRVEFVEVDAAPLDINANPLLSSMLLDPEPIVEKIVERRGAPWYVWAGVSAVAAGGAAGAVLLLTGDDTPDATTGTVIVSLPE